MGLLSQIWNTISVIDYHWKIHILTLIWNVKWHHRMDLSNLFLVLQWLHSYHLRCQCFQVREEKLSQMNMHPKTASHRNGVQKTKVWTQREQFPFPSNLKLWKEQLLLRASKLHHLSSQLQTHLTIRLNLDRNKKNLSL